MLEDVFPKAPQPLDVLAEQAHAGVNVRTSTRCRDREFVKRPFLFSGYLSGISERSASFDDFQYFHMDMCLSDSIEQETAGEEEPEEPQEEETQAARRPGKKEAASWEAFKAGDEGEADAADPDGDADMEGAAKAPKKRGRAEGATNEPPMAAALAHSAVQALLDAWEAESDSEDGQGKRGTRSKRKRGDLAASTWIQEDGEVLTVRAPPSKRLRGTQVGAAGAENKIDALRRSGLRFAADGRLVVDDAAEEKGKDEAPQFTLSQLAAQRKARAEAKAQARAARRGVHVIKGMESYKPGRKRAQGDAKRKGAKLEPFAYVRLNPKVTKEKFKTKATETFSKVIKGAKKGVLKALNKSRGLASRAPRKQARRQQVRRKGKAEKASADKAQKGNKALTGQVELKDFMHSLATKHGKKPDEYITARSEQDWEKLFVAVAGRIFNKPLASSHCLCVC
ncbi:unnamed protein product [Symbiodinium sp. KB8]|nr:unnamed protein product [Symbiodinium sp. KB8]